MRAAMSQAVCSNRRATLIPACLALAAVLCCCVGTWAQAPPLQIRAPKADPAKPTLLPKVSEVYTLSATKQNPGEGWVSIVLTKGPGVTEPRFLAAVISPYEYKWDTRVRVSGQRVYPDGQYTLQFSAHKPTGEPLGTETVSAEVQNNVPEAQIAGDIGLRHEYTARDRIRYNVRAESSLQLPVQLRPLELVLSSMQTQLKLMYISAIMDVDALGPDLPGQFEATVRNTPREGIFETQGQPPRLFPALGRTFSVKARTNGLIIPMRPELGRFAFGELYIVLPAGPVKLGHRWTSEAGVMPEFSFPQRVVVPAQHVLEGFEYLHGQKCARIRSTYRYNGDMIVIVEGAGLTVPTTMTGERATYFAYGTGQVLMIEETNQHKLRIDLSLVGRRPSGGEEEGEEEEEQQEEEENASAGGRWYAQSPTDPGAWSDEGRVVFADLSSSLDAGTVYFTQQRPTVRPPGVPGIPGPGAARTPAGGAAAGAAVPSALVVDVPYEVRVRLERAESAPGQGAAPAPGAARPVVAPLR